MADKFTKQPSERKAKNKANPNTSQAEPKIVSAPHVPHSIIATSVLIGAIGGICINIDSAPRGWLTIAGTAITLAGAILYLSMARKVEARKPIWPKILYVAGVVGVIYTLAFKVFPPIFTPMYKGNAPEVASPTPSAAYPGPEPTPIPTPGLPESFSVVIDGRLALLPEYFDSRAERKDLTTAQIQSTNDALIDKWIWFRGEIEEATYRPNQKDLLIELKRGGHSNALYVTDKQQMLLAERIGKNPASFLCVIKRSTLNVLMFTDCEVSP